MSREALEFDRWGFARDIEAKLKEGNTYDAAAAIRSRG